MRRFPSLSFFKLSCLKHDLLRRSAVGRELAPAFHARFVAREFDPSTFREQP